MAFPNVVFHTAGFVFSCLIRTTEVFGETIQFPVTYGFLFVLEDIITALIHAHQILVSRFLFFFLLQQLVQRFTGTDARLQLVQNTLRELRNLSIQLKAMRSSI